MAMHVNQVGQEARKIFADVRVTGKRVLDRFYEGFEKALKDVHKGWRTLNRKERKIVFETVQDVAKEIIVDVKDGGGAKDGLSLSTFYQYVSKIKKALIFSAPLDVAERATTMDLQRCQQYVDEVLADSDGTKLQKMEQAWEWLKGEKVKEKERMREEAAKHAADKKPSIETPFTLPNPDDYEDSDTETLLESGIQAILHWLDNKTLRRHLRKDVPAAVVLRRVVGDLHVYASEATAVA